MMESSISTGRGLWIVGVAAAFTLGLLGGGWGGYFLAYSQATDRYDEQRKIDQIHQATWSAEYVTKLKQEIEELKRANPVPPSP